jgi:hypothetical protein
VSREEGSKKCWHGRAPSARYKRVLLEAASGGESESRSPVAPPGHSEFSLNGSSCEFLSRKMDVILSALAGIALDNLAMRTSQEDVFLHW